MEDLAHDINLKRHKVVLRTYYQATHRHISPAPPWQITIHVYVQIYLMYMYIYSFKRGCKRIYKRNLKEFHYT